MNELIRLSHKEIGDAIVTQIGISKGRLFFPFRIKYSHGITVDKEVNFELELIPKGSKEEDVIHWLGEK